MKLYYSKGACSMSIHIILRELKIDCELEEVDLKTKQTRSGKNFLDINPKGAVPTLIVDNEILTENVAILQYLADTYNATSLLPPMGHFVRYHVIEWLSFLSSDVHKSFSALFNPTITQEEKDTIFFPLLEKKLEIIDKKLGNHHEYLMGINFTLPDAYLFVMLRWYIAFKRDLKKYAHLYRYFNDLKNRPSILEAMKEEGIKIE